MKEQQNEKLLSLLTACQRSNQTIQEIELYNVLGDFRARIICGVLTEKSAKDSEETPSDPTENNKKEDE